MSNKASGVKSPGGLTIRSGHPSPPAHCHFCLAAICARSVGVDEHGRLVALLRRRPALARRDHLPRPRDRQRRDRLVVPAQEFLVVRVVEVLDDDVRPDAVDDGVRVLRVAQHGVQGLARVPVAMKPKWAP